MALFKWLSMSDSHQHTQPAITPMENGMTTEVYTISKTRLNPENHMTSQVFTSRHQKKSRVNIEFTPRLPISLRHTILLTFI
jgi:hypothetical protein